MAPALLVHCTTTLHVYTDGDSCIENPKARSLDAEHCRVYRAHVYTDIPGRACDDVPFSLPACAICAGTL